MTINEIYDMTFNEIYDGFFALYQDAEEKNRAADVTVEEQALYWFYCDFYTTLLRFEKNREYTQSVEKAFNNFDRDDESSAEELCTLFFVEKTTLNAVVLFAAVEKIREGKQCK